MRDEQKDLSAYDALGPGDRIVLIRNCYGFERGTGGRICDGDDPVHTSMHGVLAQVLLDGAAEPFVLSDADFDPAG